MNRVIKLQELAKHPVLGKLFKKLTREELSVLTTFIYEHEHLDDNQFAHVANRWMIDKLKPKHFTDMWSIAIQTIEVVNNKKGVR